MQDKARFSELCATHGLPAIPTLALFRGDEQIFPSAPFVPDDADLWVKSPAGSGGQRAGCWRVEDGAYRKAGGICLVAAMLYLPSGARIVSTAGIGCSVDLDSGVLTGALNFPDQSAAIECHPDTGAVIVGRALPFWPESLKLATDAHERAFERFAFLGWDIALTEGGPLLLEANIGWVALHLQRLNGPLGLTEFGRVLETYV